MLQINFEFLELKGCDVNFRSAFFVGYSCAVLVTCTLIVRSADPVANHWLPGSTATDLTQPVWPLITYNTTSNKEYSIQHSLHFISQNPRVGIC